MRKLAKQLKDYIECWTHIGTPEMKKYYKWILRNGKCFNKIGKPKHRGKMKECYLNSQMAINDRCAYYEGWAIRKEIQVPIEHAFNVRDHIVYDRTWEDGDCYFGVEIPWDFVIEKILETEIATNLLGQYYIDRILKPKT